MKYSCAILFRFFQPMKYANGLVWGVLFALSGCFSAAAQPARPVKEWTHLAAPPADKAGAARWVQPLRGELFRLEHATLRAKLATVARGEPSAAKTIGSEIELPMPDGTTARYTIVEAPVMAPELAAKFPEIKTYAGQGIDDPGATVRLDLSPAGFHAQVLSPRGAVYVDPAYRGDASNHVCYYKRDYRKDFEDWHCLAEGSATAGKGLSGGSVASGVVANKIQSGTTLRTYRLAVACTGEYAAYFGGTVSNAMAAIVSAVNRVDGVYETELAVRLVLIANNNLIVYTNANTDPYANTSGSTMLGQNQTTLDSVIGSANYDIGHVFSTGGGGIAGLGVVCGSSKAQGVTGSPAPTGDAFWIDYVAHEMGHQFGADHTFNSTNSNCGGGNRNASTSFEPGSGSTIMAYAGICSPDDLQPHSDPYFHAGSLDEIQTYLAGAGGGCAVNTATGNSAPNVSGGANYIIPASTPFVLTATGSDPNGDALTYCWEEMDAGSPAALTTADNGSMALFRSFNPTSSPARYFPKLESVLANTNWNQEKLPTTGRTLKFRVTARDNRVGGGGVADADITVTSVGGSGPFVVTSPNTATNWSGVRTVTWNVAGTASSPISTSGVNIYLSTNGGASFPILLATNAPNSGAATVVLPNLATSTARIIVQGAGNIFYDVSDVDFSITPGAAASLVQLAGTALVAESCAPTNGAIDPFETVSVNWSLMNVGTAPTTNLVATLLATNGVYYPGAAQNYGAIAPGGTVTRAFTFTPAGVVGGSVTGLVRLVDGATSLGSVAAVFPLGLVQATTVTQIFNNVTAIAIRDVTSALPYPSTIVVSGVSTQAVKVTATLNGFTHTYPSDVSMLLVGPGGQKVLLDGGAGGGTPVSKVAVTLDDSSAIALPSAAAITSGIFRPAGYFTRTFKTPAPSGTYGTNLTRLAASPNGTWSLYVEDFASGDTGGISNGWSLSFVSSIITTNSCSTFPAPGLTSTTWSNKVVRFNWSALPGPHYQVQYRTNLTLGAWQNLGSPILGTNTILGITDNASNSSARFYRVSVGP
jgi:subtilisin-like proprotein convertase family protein